MYEIEEKLRGIDTTKIFFTDLNGRAMALPVNHENINSIVSKGIGFDGSSVAGITTIDDSDRLLFPIPESLRVVKFNDEKVGFLIGKIRNGFILLLRGLCLDQIRIRRQ